MSTMKNVVVLGGGTGSYVTLLGLKRHSNDLNLTAIVTVADSGGSAKQERDEFGLLPVSDVRKALIALARDSDERRQWILREIFNYRFVNGQAGLKGGTFGNLLLVVLSNILGSEQAAIEEAESMLQTEGQVVPVSLTTSNLVMEYDNGQVIVGEHYLDDFPGDGTRRVNKAYLLPTIKANPKALAIIKEADVIIFPPGDLYASVIANLLVEGITDAIKTSSAKLIYFVNLMTKYGQTYEHKATDHVAIIEYYLGRKLDHILINNRSLPQRVLTAYAKEKDFPVKDDLKKDTRVVCADLLQPVRVRAQMGDKLKRSLIRHDPKKIASCLMKLINKDK